MLHRDIKPSNLLLDAKANPWVTDFGLAKTLEADDLTSTGDSSARFATWPRALRGAMRCAVRPVQFRPHALRAGRTAAGIRCGRSTRADRTDAPRAPTSLRKLDPHIPRDLETIMSKLTAREPAHRYGSAAALADDLRRFLEDRPIQARPASAASAEFGGAGATRGSRRFWWRSPSVRSPAPGRPFARPRPCGSPRLAETASRKERYRAERSRDRAPGAVRKLLETGSYESHADELGPDRESLITASLAEAQALMRELEGDPRTEYQRIEAYAALVRTQLDAGHAAMALTSAGTAVSLAEELVARDPSSAEYRGSVALALHRLSCLGVTDECQTAARRSNELCRQLAAQGPDDERGLWLRMIAINHYNIGSCDFGKRQFTDAIESFLAAASNCRQLIRPRWRAPEFSYFAVMVQLHLSRLYAREKQPDRRSRPGTRPSRSPRRLSSNIRNQSNIARD